MRKNYTVILIINIILIGFVSASEPYLCPVKNKITTTEIITEYKMQKIDYNKILNSNNSYKPNVWFVDRKDPANVIFYCEFKMVIDNPVKENPNLVCEDPSTYTIKFILDQERRIQNVVFKKRYVFSWLASPLAFGDSLVHSVPMLPVSS